MGGGLISPLIFLSLGFVCSLVVVEEGFVRLGKVLGIGKAQQAACNSARAWVPTRVSCATSGFWEGEVPLLHPCWDDSLLLTSCEAGSALPCYQQFNPIPSVLPRG